MKYNFKFWILLLAVVPFNSCIVEEDGPELVLNNMQINQITVEGFPNTNNGADWDFWTSYPNVFVKIYLGGNSLYTSEYYDECVNTNTYNYNRSLPLQLNDPSLEYTINLWDYDSTGDNDPMGGYRFTPSNYEGDDEILFYSENSEIVIRLRVEWNYKEV